MIQVVNKYKHKATPNDFYIGRGSPLGNPFTHLSGQTKAEHKVATREEAIEKYVPWLEKARLNDVVVATTLDKVFEKALAGDVNLVCFCKPQACHGDVIKKLLDEWVQRSQS